MIKINTGILYPLTSDVKYIRILVKLKQINKIYTKIIEVQEMHRKLCRAEGKIIIMEACL